VHENYGIVLASDGQLDLAITELQAALRLGRDTADLRNGLGATLLAKGRRKQARVHFKKALALRPGFVDAEENLKAAT